AATTLAVLCAGQTLAAPQAAAAPAPAAALDVRTSPASEVHAAEDAAARAVAAALTDPAWRVRVRQAALTSDEVAVTDLADGALKTTLAAADRRIAAAKGLAPDVGPLLRLRLGDPSMRGALTAGTQPWVAAATSDDGPVTAYDSTGRTHT
ncbi:DUF3103 family protein, partial [Streptomyces sp. DH12]|uniref:DUF3103 family protein n=1 Tax=Streptomyces sp. DH12 TaxID=2857010 RepID=UPI001E3FDBAD